MLAILQKAFYVRLSALSLSLSIHTCRHSDDIFNVCRQAYTYSSRSCLNSNPWLFRHWNVLNSMDTSLNQRPDSAAELECVGSEMNDDSGIVVESPEKSADSIEEKPMETGSSCEACQDTEEAASQSKKTKGSILSEDLLSSVTSLVKEGKVEVSGTTEESSTKSCSKKKKKKRRRQSENETVDTKRSMSPKDDMAGISDEDVKSKTGKKDSGPSSAKHPTHFVSIQINNPEIHRSMKDVQEAILGAEKNVDKAMVSVATAHLTLLVIRLETEEDISRAGASLERCVAGEWASYADGTDRLELELAGLGHFDHTVLFAKVSPGSHLDVVKNIAVSVEKFLSEDGIQKADPKPFSPHVTLMKFTKRRAFELRKKGIKRIKAELYKDHLEQKFGSDTVRSLQLCSMVKPKDATTGYYHIEHQVHFGEPVVPNAETSSAVKSVDESEQMVPGTEPSSVKVVDESELMVSDAEALSAVKSVDESEPMVPGAEPSSVKTVDENEPTVPGAELPSVKTVDESEPMVSDAETSSSVKSVDESEPTLPK